MPISISLDRKELDPTTGLKPSLGTCPERAFSPRKSEKAKKGT
jgi:hypothetical protein